MREKGQTEVAKTLETPVFSRGIEILTEKNKFLRYCKTLVIQRTFKYLSIISMILFFFGCFDYQKSGLDEFFIEPFSFR